MRNEQFKKEFSEKIKKPPENLNQRKLRRIS
jgi:hypothetical protein